jgi:GTP-binding protein LepA
MLACEGAILLVDATQGVEAQTISNLYLALEHDLEIIPVINKIDLPGAATEEVKQEIMELLGVKEDEIILASAKENIGTREILERVVRDIPPPAGDSDNIPKALVFDSVYDNYRGAIAYIRMFEGTIKKGDKIKFLSTSNIYEVLEIGHFRLRRDPSDSLVSGDVGYIITGMKDLRDIKVGDTITLEKENVEAIEGFQDVKPMVFCGFFPADGEDVEKLGEALNKLQLNDAALTMEHENSPALGFGYRCGFLGLLHMSIVQERLEKEHNVSLVATMPSVRYRVILRDGSVVEVDNPAEMPDAKHIESVEEPYIEAEIVTPPDYVGNVLRICEERRGEQQKLEYITANRVEIVYHLPENSLISNYILEAS